MQRFKYEITKHPADEFIHLVYFCTDEGECDFDQLPSNQITILVN